MLKILRSTESTTPPGEGVIKIGDDSKAGYDRSKIDRSKLDGSKIDDGEIESGKFDNEIGKKD